MDGFAAAGRRPNSRGLENKKAPEGAFVIFPLRREDIGAGEGIRTLDPNLGKVMLYP
jgi:hypothetical protein